MRRFRVLLITSKKHLPPGSRVIGDSPVTPFGDREVEDYIELLSASNFPFDIVYIEELSIDAITSEGVVHYTTIILTVPENELPDEKVNIIKQVSYEHGVSILASFNRVNRKLSEIFGIRSISGRRYSFPCKLIFNGEKLSDSTVTREITLGEGFKIELQRWGFRKDPVRYIKRHFKKLWGQVWCYKKVDMLPAADIIATIKGKNVPAVTRYRFGKGVNYYFALYSDTFLDRFDSLHKIVREFIRENSGWGMVEINLENTMVIRMDDPGTCERVYLKEYDTRILGDEDWRDLEQILRKLGATLSVMYVPLWVDDGSRENGKLYIDRVEVMERRKGATYNSKDVVFIKHDGTPKKIVYDYVSEYQILKRKISAGLVDVESHGLTHIDTDIDRWAGADDRYTNVNWYHEFRNVIDDRDVSGREQSRVARESAEKINEFFGVSPTAITPSGHEQSGDSEEIAHAAGYKLFSGEYTSFVKNGLVIRNDKVNSIFLDLTDPDRSFSESGYPVIGVFHDYDIVKRGTGWLDETIEQWKNKGINRFIALRELAGYLCSEIDAYLSGRELHCEVDISKTGCVNNSPKSSYFFENCMNIDITVPYGMVPHDVLVEGNGNTDFHYRGMERKIGLTLPPFGTKNKQKIMITFSDDSSGMGQ